MAWTKVHRSALDINGTTPLAVTNSPAAAQNDILYAAVTSFTTSVVTGPSGWSVIATADIGTGESKVQLWKKIAGAGEGTSYSWSDNLGQLTTIDFFQLTGGDTTTSEDVTPSTHVLGAGQLSITATSITTVTDGALLIAWWLESGAAQSITPDASMTGEGNNLATGFPLALGSGSLTQTTHGATGDKTGSWTPNTTSAGAILLAVRPLVTSAPWPNVTMDEVLPVIVTQTPGASDWTSFPDYLASRFLWTYRAWQPPPPPAFNYREFQPLGKAALISLNSAPPVAVILEPIWPQPVPPPAVAGVQPIPDNWLPFLSFLEQFPIVRGPQPVPPAAVAGIQPYVRLPWLPVEHQINFAYRGPGPQPVPGPAIAGAQPGNFTWLAFQGISDMRFTGQGPQPVPPIAVAGAQPPVRIGWFVEAVPGDFAFANWPQPDGT